MSDKALPNWVKVSKKRFDAIKNSVQNAKGNNLQARPQHASLINFDNSNKLIQDIVHGNITYEDALKKMPDINDNFTNVTELKSLNPNQIKAANTYFMVNEIFTGKTKKFMEDNEGELYLFKSKSNHSNKQKESNTIRQRFAEQPNEQPDTTNMPDLESEESAAQGKEQKGKGLKILTPNQMLNRLPICLAQLKARNNSEKLKNEIRQLLYFLYRSKKLTNQIYKSLIDII